MSPPEPNSRPLVTSLASTVPRHHRGPLPVQEVTTSTPIPSFLISDQCFTFAHDTLKLLNSFRGGGNANPWSCAAPLSTTGRSLYPSPAGRRAPKSLSLLPGAAQWEGLGGSHVSHAPLRVEKTSMAKDPSGSSSTGVQLHAHSRDCLLALPTSCDTLLYSPDVARDALLLGDPLGDGRRATAWLAVFPSVS